jgi:hypothetical protein
VLITPAGPATDMDGAHARSWRQHYHIGRPGVTGGQIPPLWVPLAELARWLQEMHELTQSEIRDLVVDLRRWPTNFQVEDEIITGWPGWKVEWEAGRARWKQDPDGIDYPLEVSWDAVTDAVTRLRKRQERLAVQAPAPRKGGGQGSTPRAGA